MEQTRLPLRLAAEPHARRLINNCFLLPTKYEDSVCLIINSNGLWALATDKLYTTEALSKMLDNLAFEDLPEYCFVFNSLKWFNRQGQELLGDAAAAQSKRTPARSISNGSQSRQIIEGIHRYYSRQVLEPSIRGFLSILEKTFPRNDLYLFELLQNAVDDGAMNVSFTPRPSGLYFIHDGRPFTAMDCLGLSSVGLSTKGSNSGDEKRTIGFMGIGFKAVYKRFAKVTIYDSNWCFSFEEPLQPAPMEPSHGWVLKPQWRDNRSQLWDSSQSSATSAWCHFQLERSRNGSNSPAEDLRYLPVTIPALLGRQALQNRRMKASMTESLIAPVFGDEVIANEFAAIWSLEWNTTTHNVSFLPSSAVELVSVNGTDNYRKYSLFSECVQVFETNTNKANPGSGVKALSNTRNTDNLLDKKKYWQFISLKYTPDASAQDAYEAHTKRRWNPNASPNTREETCIFFELNDSGIPIAGQSSSPGMSKGFVHAVLPTKLELPTPMQWQGSWLLSVDRQEVQNVTDNLWNNCIIRQIPKLLAGLIMWSTHVTANAMSTHQRFEKLIGSYTLLPPMTATDSNTKLSTTLLGVPSDLSELIELISSRQVIPSLSTQPTPNSKAGVSSEEILQFIEPKNSIWLPYPFLNRLSSKALQNWFGKKIMATNRLPIKMNFLPIWKVIVPRPTSTL